MSNIDPSSPLAMSIYPQHLVSDRLISRSIIQQDVDTALAEDLGIMSLNNDSIGSQDITAQLIAHDTLVTAQIICRDDAVIAGIAWATYAFERCHNELTVQWHVKDGQTVPPATRLATITGNGRAILTAERVALNFLQTLSATATVTRSYVRKLEGSGITLLDTRKTLPKIRFAQKYAVQCGQGQNHRIGLFDAFLIKENHIFACGGIDKAITQAKIISPNTLIEVEVENIDELQQAIQGGADVIMLDNFSTKQIHEAVAINAGKSKLEVSGNITDARIAEVKDTGVDFISSGALTKNIHAVDLSLRIID